MFDEDIIKQYENIVDKTNIVSKTNPKWIITYVNEKFCEISWYKREELIGKPHNIVRHPDMPKEVFKELWDTLTIQKTSWEWIVKNKKKNGWYYWVKTIISPIFDHDGNLVEYISIRWDITNLKDSIKMNHDYKSILEQSNLLVILDKAGTIKYVNDKFCNTSTFRYDELIGRKYIDFIPKKIRNSEEKIYQEVIWIIDIKEKEIGEIMDTLNRKENWRGVIKNKGKIGNTFWTSTIIIPILDFDGNINEFYLVQTDITDLEIAKNQLKKSFNELKELDQKKDDFLNIASHELRTPMTSIKWYLSMILDGDIGNVDDEAKMYLSRVYNNVENLLWLINDMLDITKMESGKVQFLKEKSDLALLIWEVISELGSFAQSKNITVNNEIKEIDLFFVCDKMRFKQVIANILGNAIKFTPEWGKVNIQWYIKDAHIFISIQDNGIWIAKEDLKKIFNKFWQVKNSLTRDIWGTGLWLSIAKAIVKHFKWEIKVSSQEWLGSEFIIVLPK